ncbi:MAG: hypothetical protein JWM53_6883 [bacterium]|jgi:hypothetical protein|nr:hypothetical protein [bacterium]
MRTVILLLGLMLSFGCSHKTTTSGDPTADPSDPSNGANGSGVFAPSALQVTGRIVDFETGQPLASSGTMATAAVVPPPNVSMSGGNFTLEGVPPFSVFYLIAGSPPDHRLTYNAPTTVTDQPLADVNAYVVADAYLAKLRTVFGVTAQSGTATVFLRAGDATGAATTGVSAAALVVPGTGVKGPFFVDAKLQAAPTATATSSSGWMVYFNVPTGTLVVAPGAGYSVAAADTPVAADAVSLVSATVAKATAPTPPPANVSFQNTVLPIFIQRGCYNCHSGNGAGRRMGDLVLDGSAMKIYAALTSDISPNFSSTRVNLKDPAKSLVLTMPSLETPPDPHPTVVFTSSADVDYQKILVWIKEGAKFN